MIVTVYVIINSHWPAGRSKGQCSAYEAPTYWRFLSKPLLIGKNCFFPTVWSQLTLEIVVVVVRLG